MFNSLETSHFQEVETKRITKGSSSGPPGQSQLHCRSQRMFCRPAVPAALGSCQKCRCSGPTPDPLHQRLWGWPSHVYFNNIHPPGDADVCSSLRSSQLQPHPSFLHWGPFKWEWKTLQTPTPCPQLFLPIPTPLPVHSLPCLPGHPTSLCVSQLSFKGLLKSLPPKPPAPFQPWELLPAQNPHALISPPLILHLPIYFNTHFPKQERSVFGSGTLALEFPASPTP